MQKLTEKTNKIVSLNIGEVFASRDPAVVSTVLGSCVAVCLFSSRGRGGGINHFALPYAEDANSAVISPYRYGDISIKALIEALLSLPDIKLSDLRAKIIGGACVKGHGVVNEEVGSLNVKAAREVLSKFKIPIVGEDIGGSQGKKIFFYTDSGRLRVSSVEREGLASSPGKAKVLSKAAAPAESPVFTEKNRPIRVLVVDDSTTIQNMLKAILSRDPQIEVVGVAANPIEAEKILAKVKVDVLTLDIHMPLMDGVTFLGQLMSRNPLPVVMITAMNAEDGNQVIKALELGAVDYLQKPKLSDLDEVGSVIRDKIKGAAVAKIKRPQASGYRVQRGPKVLSKDQASPILAIGASTGGTEALKQVLLGLAADIPPIVIVQHIPALFSKAFANRLNELCPFEVKEAEHGDRLLSGRVLVAPGGLQMSIEPERLGFKVKIIDAPPVNRHKPSVDVLFDSIALYSKGKAMGVILTGMGSDGAAGLLAMKRVGCYTVAQDEQSCVVFGMPKEAIRLGGVDDTCALELIPRRISEWMHKRKRA